MKELFGLGTDRRLAGYYARTEGDRLWISSIKAIILSLYFQFPLKISKRYRSMPDSTKRRG
jgi:hypothetical protein